jgi:hypothetical protein
LLRTEFEMREALRNFAHVDASRSAAHGQRAEMPWCVQTFCASALLALQV